jgi:hypothetical protein
MRLEYKFKKLFVGYPQKYTIMADQFKMSANYVAANQLNFYMTIFEFIGQFFFQNDVFKLQEVFSELKIRVLRMDLKISRYFIFNRFETNQKCYNDSKNSFGN